MSEATPILLSFDNLANPARGTTIATSLPLATGNMVIENALNLDLSQKYRSGTLVGGKDPQLDISFDRSRRVDCVSVHATNARIQWHTIFYDGAVGASTELYDSNTLEAVVGSPDDEDLAIWTAESRLFHHHKSPQVFTNVRSIRVEFLNVANTNNGVDWVEVGGLLISESLTPSVNFLLGSVAGVEDDSIQHRTLGQSLLGRRREPRKTFRFSLPMLSEAEAMERLYRQWIRRYGALGRAFVVPRPDKTALYYEQAFLGTLTRSGAVEAAFADLWSAEGWQMEETF